MRFNKNAFYLELARNCMTLKELATKSGLNVMTISAINKGTQNPQPATIGKLAQALNVDAETLLIKED